MLFLTFYYIATTGSSHHASRWCFTASSCEKKTVQFKNEIIDLFRVLLWIQISLQWKINSTWFCFYQRRGLDFFEPIVRIWKVCDLITFELVKTHSTYLHSYQSQGGFKASPAHTHTYHTAAAFDIHKKLGILTLFSKLFKADHPCLFPFARFYHKEIDWGHYLSVCMENVKIQ